MNLTPPKSTLFPYTTLFRSSGLWRSVTERGGGPTGSVTGCAARHEARHSPRLRLGPPCSRPRPRPGVAELGVVRRLYTHTLEPKSMKNAVLALVATLALAACDKPSPPNKPSPP